MYLNHKVDGNEASHRGLLHYKIRVKYNQIGFGYEADFEL